MKCHIATVLIVYAFTEPAKGHKKKTHDIIAHLPRGRLHDIVDISCIKSREAEALYDTGANVLMSDAVILSGDLLKIFLNYLNYVSLSEQLT